MKKPPDKTGSPSDKTRRLRPRIGTGEKNLLSGNMESGRARRGGPRSPERAEKDLRKENREMALANRMLEVFVRESGDDLFEKALNVLLEGMASKHGVFGYIDEQGILICPTMSRLYDQCEMKGKCLAYPPDEWRGIWSRSLREKRTFYSNEPARVPPGHVAIRRHLATPIIFQDRVIGLFNVANKETDYKEEDRKFIEAVSARISPVLFALIQKELGERERKQAEEALRKSEARLNRSQEIAHLGSWELDLATNTLSWSDEVYRIFGLRPREFAATYEAFLEAVHPDDRAAVDAAYSSSLLKGQQSYEIEHRVVRKTTGEVRWVQEKCQHLFDSTGRAVRSLGMVLDITERKQGENVVRARLRMLEAAHTAKSVDEILQAALDEIEKLTGSMISFYHFLEADQETLSLQNWSTHTLGNMCTAEGKGSHYPVSQAGVWVDCVHERGPVIHNDYTSLPHRKGMPPGHAPIVREMVIPIMRGGRIVAIIGVGNKPSDYIAADVEIASLLGDFSWEIVERMRMEEELRKSRVELEERVAERTAELKQQAELLDLARDAIVLEEMGGTISLWSDGAAEMYGWSKEEAVGKVMRFLLKTEYPLSREEIIAGFTRDGRWEGELNHTRKDGRKIRVLSRWTLKKDRLGNPEHIMLINHDITERIKLEEQLRQAQRLEALGTLAGGIAHDFNNLLQPILINTDMALLDVKAGTLPSRESLWLAREGARRGAELVKQIITFSRHKEHPRGPVEIFPIIRETLKLVQSTLPATIEIRDRLETEMDVVLADRIQIHQVCMNLCNNAVHAMREKGGVLEVSLSKVEVAPGVPGGPAGLNPGAYLQLTVKDNGHGMPPEVRERAFDPFFTTKKQGEGTGLGLSVVHGIVTRLDGAITLDTEAGVGTTVTIFLPIIQGGPKESISPGPILTGKGRILLVDDEEFQVRTLKAVLERLGYEVTARMDAHEALEIFRSRADSFDLVITDYVMPRLSGDRLAAACLSIRPEIPVILCTGFNEKIDEGEARSLGIREFAMKPFSVGEIANMVARCLG